jgi:hypothetical protein
MSPRDGVRIFSGIYRDSGILHFIERFAIRNGFLYLETFSFSYIFTSPAIALSAGKYILLCA